jgi:methionine sulfoxide reductase heme-binding subunit
LATLASSTVIKTAPWWKQPSARAVLGVKCALFALLLLPFARLVWRAMHDQLGANPVEFVTRATGWWVLFLLCVTLCVTPARKLLGMPWLLRVRRMLGVFAFFYAVLHFTTYIWLDQGFEWSGIPKDIVKRPFITVGFAAFVLLIPLAATSFNAAIKRLGGKRWQALHKAIYAIAILGVLHFLWHKLGKNIVLEPAMFAVAVAVLLGWRVVQWRAASASTSNSSNSSNSTATSAAPR